MQYFPPAILCSMPASDACAFWFALASICAFCCSPEYAGPDTGPAQVSVCTTAFSFPHCEQRQATSTSAETVFVVQVPVRMPMTPHPLINVCKRYFSITVRKSRSLRFQAAGSWEISVFGHKAGELFYAHPPMRAFAEKGNQWISSSMFTRRSWRPPSKGVSRKSLARRLAVSMVTTFMPMESTLALLWRRMYSAV